MTQAPASPAQTYEEYFVPGMFGPWADELVDRARPQPGERVLDLACGTGVVARTVARRLDGQATLVGLDLSPAMIEVAGSVAKRDGVDVVWHVGSADALPFPDASFDLILIQQGLQFFPDKPAALREVFRVLAPGGRVASATWTEIGRNPFNEAFGEAIRRHLGTPAMHTPFSFGDRGALEALYGAARFAPVEIEVVRREVRFPSPERFVELGVVGRSAAVPEMQTMGEAELAQLIDGIRAEMTAPIREYAQGDDLVFPMEAHIVVAHKPG